MESADRAQGSGVGVGAGGGGGALYTTGDVADAVIVNVPKNPPITGVRKVNGRLTWIVTWLPVPALFVAAVEQLTATGGVAAVWHVGALTVSAPVSPTCDWVFAS